MGFFEDKEYDKMDWISQAVEPIKSPLNDILAKLPETLEITYPVYNQITRQSYGLGLNVSEVVKWLASKANVEIEYEGHDAVEACFQFEIEPNSEIDFEKKLIKGNIRVIKIKQQLDDRDLSKTLGAKGMSDLTRRLRHRRGDEEDPQMFERLNEIIDTLDCNHESRKNRSMRKKIHAIYNLVQDIMTNNKWNIKDAELANKVAYWIADYAVDGSLPAFSNIIKLKLMTHKGLPIYSMVENKV